jgi:hypothetical protein
MAIKNSAASTAGFRQHFLLELGTGFLFEARQKRFSFDADHFYVDRVFYNRLLRWGSSCARKSTMPWWRSHSPMTPIFTPRNTASTCPAKKTCGRDSCSGVTSRKAQRHDPHRSPNANATHRHEAPSIKPSGRHKDSSGQARPCTRATSGNSDCARAYLPPAFARTQMLRPRFSNSALPRFSSTGAT